MSVKEMYVNKTISVDFDLNAKIKKFFEIKQASGCYGRDVQTLMHLKYKIFTKNNNGSTIAFVIAAGLNVYMCVFFLYFSQNLVVVRTLYGCLIHFLFLFVHHSFYSYYTHHSYITRTTNTQNTLSLYIYIYLM